MKRKRPALAFKVAKPPRVMDLATEEVVSIPDMASLVKEVKKCFDTEGLEKGHDSMLKLVRLECFSAMNLSGDPGSGSNAKDDILCCEPMVQGLGSEVFWLLHIGGTLSFHTYLKRLETIKPGALYDFIKAHLLMQQQHQQQREHATDMVMMMREEGNGDSDEGMLEPICEDIVLYLYNEAAGVSLSLSSPEAKADNKSRCARFLSDLAVPCMYNNSSNAASGFGYLDLDDLRMLQRIINIVGSGSSGAAERERSRWQVTQVTKLLSCLVEVPEPTSRQGSSNSSVVADTLTALFGAMDEGVLSTALELALRSGEGGTAGASREVLEAAALCARESEQTIRRRSVLLLLLDLCARQATMTAHVRSLLRPETVLDLALEAAQQAMSCESHDDLLRAVCLALRMTRAMSSVATTSFSSTSQRGGKLLFQNWLARLFGLDGKSPPGSTAGPERPAGKSGKAGDEWDTGPTYVQYRAPAGVGGGSVTTLNPQVWCFTAYLLSRVVQQCGEDEVQAFVKVSLAARQVASGGQATFAVSSNPDAAGGKENQPASASATTFGGGGALGIDRSAKLREREREGVIKLKRAHEALLQACKRRLVALEEAADPLRAALFVNQTKKAGGGIGGDGTEPVSAAVLQELGTRLPSWMSTLEKTSMLPVGVRSQATLLGSSRGGVLLMGAVCKLVGSENEQGVLITRDMAVNLVNAMAVAGSGGGGGALLKQEEKSYFLSCLRGSSDAQHDYSSSQTDASAAGDNAHSGHNAPPAVVAALALPPGIASPLLSALMALHQATRAATSSETGGMLGNDVSRTLISSFLAAAEEASRVALFPLSGSTAEEKEDDGASHAIKVCAALAAAVQGLAQHACVFASQMATADARAAHLRVWGSFIGECTGFILPAAPESAPTQSLLEAFLPSRGLLALLTPAPAPSRALALSSLALLLANLPTTDAAISLLTALLARSEGGGTAADVGDDASDVDRLGWLLVANDVCLAAVTALVCRPGSTPLTAESLVAQVEAGFTVTDAPSRVPPPALPVLLTAFTSAHCRLRSVGLAARAMSHSSSLFSWLATLLASQQVKALAAASASSLPLDAAIGVASTVLCSPLMRFALKQTQVGGTFLPGECHQDHNIGTIVRVAGALGQRLSPLYNKHSENSSEESALWAALHSPVAAICHRESSAHAASAAGKAAATVRLLAAPAEPAPQAYSGVEDGDNGDSEGGARGWYHRNQALSWCIRTSGTDVPGYSTTGEDLSAIGWTLSEAHAYSGSDDPFPQPSTVAISLANALVAVVVSIPGMGLGGLLPRLLSCVTPVLHSREPSKIVAGYLIMRSVLACANAAPGDAAHASSVPAVETASFQAVARLVRSGALFSCDLSAYRHWLQVLRPAACMACEQEDVLSLSYLATVPLSTFSDDIDGMQLMPPPLVTAAASARFLYQGAACSLLAKHSGSGRTSNPAKCLSLLRALRSRLAGDGLFLGRGRAVKAIRLAVELLIVASELADPSIKSASSVGIEGGAEGGGGSMEVVDLLSQPADQPADAFDSASESKRELALFTGLAKAMETCCGAGGAIAADGTCSSALLLALWLIPTTMAMTGASSAHVSQLNELFSHSRFQSTLSIGASDLVGNTQGSDVFISAHTSQGQSQSLGGLGLAQARNTASEEMLAHMLACCLVHLHTDLGAQSGSRMKRKRRLGGTGSSSSSSAAASTEPLDEKRLCRLMAVKLAPRYHSACQHGGRVTKGGDAVNEAESEVWRALLRGSVPVPIAAQAVQSLALYLK